MVKNKFKNICIITSNYPLPKFPERGAFIENHVRRWQNKGLSVNVIAPVSIFEPIKSLRKKKHNIDIAGNSIQRPFYLTYSNRKINSINTRILNTNSFVKSAMRKVKKTEIPDFYYGKFLMNGGIAALKAGKKYNRPAYADLGESRLTQKMDNKELEIASQVISGLGGLICVSERLVNEVINLGADPNNVLYAPNTVDANRFFPMEKKLCRKQLGLPEKEFIVLFVGHLIVRKGPLRVLEAINSLDIPVKGIFLGRGKQNINGEKVLYTDSVPNDKLPLWLNAADLFVLPTLAEGYCNAINEAIACGLPIISSDIPDIRQQVSKKMGILVDPMNIKEIANAIQTIYFNDELREQYRNHCIEYSKLWFSESRADKILNWVEKKESFK